MEVAFVVYFFIVFLVNSFLNNIIGRLFGQSLILFTHTDLKAPDLVGSYNRVKSISVNDSAAKVMAFRKQVSKF